MPYTRLSDDELEREIGHYETDHDRFTNLATETGAQARCLKKERERRRALKMVKVPYWVLEVISAHARKRFENIAPRNRTRNYERALKFVKYTIGEVWPRDIDGEHHGCTPPREE